MDNLVKFTLPIMYLCLYPLFCNFHCKLFFPYFWWIMSKIFKNIVNGISLIIFFSQNISLACKNDDDDDWFCFLQLVYILIISWSLSVFLYFIFLLSFLKSCHLQAGILCLLLFSCAYFVFLLLSVAKTFRYLVE